MKKTAIGTALLLTLTGCAGVGPNQTIGAGAGAVGGYAVSQALGGGSRSSAIGAVAGALLGASVGGSMDRQNMQEQQMHHRPQQHFGHAPAASHGESSAYNRGRMEFEAEQQRRREYEAYMRGRRGF